MNEKRKPMGVLNRIPLRTYENPQKFKINFSCENDQNHNFSQNENYNPYKDLLSKPNYQLHEDSVHDFRSKLTLNDDKKIQKKVTIFHNTNNIINHNDNLNASFFKYSQCY